MKLRRIASWLAALAAATFVFSAAAQTAAAPSEGEALTAQGCLTCHDAKKKIRVTGADGTERELRGMDPLRFARGAHGEMTCTSCHTDIVDNKARHQKAAPVKLDCAGCHEKLWDKIKEHEDAAAQPGLALVAAQIDTYRLSVHSQPNADEPDRANANCAGCHDVHTFTRVPEKGPKRVAFRQAVPQNCGTCHEDQLESWDGSVHAEVNQRAKNKAKAAICTDCHNPHGVDRMSADVAKLRTTTACMSCHKEKGKSYTDTYHGKITKLGYAYTAQCFNCHDNHEIHSPEDEESKVHPDNRLKTCQKCHKEATIGFVSFQPHANTHDFESYPQVWVTSKFMIGLLAGTFAFFWVHLILWLYREIQDRRQGKTRPHVNVAALGIPPGKEVRRFGPWWRLGHLLFAISLMILTLTGMTIMYADSNWAPIVVEALGGPRTAGIIHRTAAVVFASIFVIHLIYIAGHLLRNWRTFEIFGPNSLIPGIQDLKDVIAMFKWFLGMGPRPVFDRWTYWEKFDYWAPFWGVTIVGVSGFMMWFPNITAKFLPGWVFNVASLTHGEEAFLAAVFLFTVHFFNNHFRPDKFPFDPVMFTGSVPVEEFAREHTVQYRRLLESGELKKHLVDAPSRPFTIASHALGFVLIGFGLVLLGLIANGFFRMIAGS
jgi:predicted CXXCH cytochrome family protein